MRLKECFSENKQQSLQTVLQENWKKLSNEYCQTKGVNVLTTHLYMAKRGGILEEEPGGERPLMIGNADVVYSDAIPCEIQYAALGHLHRYHDVGSNQPVVYSGSPLVYSFSEAGQQKYVSIVDIEPNEVPKIQSIKLESGRQLKRKSFDTVDEAVSWLSENPNTLVELTLIIDEYLKSDERKRILQIHNGIIHLIPKIKNDKLLINKQKQIDLNQDMEQLFVDYFKSKNGGQIPNEEILVLFKEIQNH
jgi:exonuclease SbcD